MDTTTNPVDPKAEPNKEAEFKEKMGSASGAGDKPNPQDNAGNKPAAEPKKPEGETKSEPPQEHDWKKRYDGTAQDLKRVSEEHQQIIDTNAKLVQKKPEILDDLAETDPNLADQVVKKAFGYDSYEAYRKEKEIEELKETDPAQYDTQKRLSKLEQTVAGQVKSVKKAFYEAKGIADNPYDPDYKKVEAQIKLLNKEFVEENPQRAYEIAHSLAFPKGEETAEQKAKREAQEQLARETTKAGGNSSSSMPAAKTGRFKNPEAKGFNEKFKSLTGMK